MSTFVSIDTQYIRPEYALAFIREEDGEVAFIETNTALAVPRLLAVLAEHGFKREQVRSVVVTHAHLDHAGGAWAMMEACPNATLYAHPRAARHLIDPSRLDAGARQVYGDADFVKYFGALHPIPKERVVQLADGDAVPLGKYQFKTYHTEGHAKHHVIVHDPKRDVVFAGDTYGIVYPWLQRNALFAFASTSPVDFDGPAALRSIEIVQSLKPKTVIPTHAGEFSQVKAIGDQVRSWVEFAVEAMNRARAEIPPAEHQAWLEKLLDAEFRRRAAAQGIALTHEDREKLDTDIRLNAMGLAIAAAAASKPAKS